MLVTALKKKPPEKGIHGRDLCLAQTLAARGGLRERLSQETQLGKGTRAGHSNAHQQAIFHCESE